MNRREFVGRTGAGALTALSYSRIVGANDRVGMALIGSGRRGREVMRAFVSSGRIELRSLCDVYDVQRERAKSVLLSAGQSVHETQAHEESIARPDVDAVLIATPDHLHLGQTQAALAAGRHVYLEKPTSHQWEESAAFREAVRRSGKVCQTGTQQRSGAHYRRVKEEIFGRGRLGKVVFARATWHDFPWQRRKIEPQPRPAGLAWERFLGPARRIPYEWIRYDSWRYFPDYGGGLLADILTHWADVAQWMLDDPHPLAAVAGGGIYQLRDGRVNPDTVNAIIEYGGGRNGPWNLTFESSVLSIRHERPGVFFQGTEGTLELTRAGYLFQPNQGPAEEGKAEGTLEVAHVHNFLEAIVRGTPLSAGIETGLEGCRPVHLAQAAFWKRRRMQMDPSAQRIF